MPGEKTVVKFNPAVVVSLRKKMKDNNKRAKKGGSCSLPMLKAVYRRGANSYSKNHRPGQNRDQWAMARVDAFLKLLRSGKPDNSAYTQDNDLLPSGHPKCVKKPSSAITASALVPEEQDFADAILAVVEKHGKFDEDGEGVWAGYTPASENEDSDIGVTCANCVFYGGGDQCAIIALPVEPMGKCRLAVLPDGAVDPSKETDIENMSLELASSVAEKELLVDISDDSQFSSTESAILALTEFSGLGYESEFAIKASWIRGVKDNENPFERAKQLAILKYDSRDSDLLPKEGTTAL